MEVDGVHGSSMLKQYDHEKVDLAQTGGYRDNHREGAGGSTLVLSGMVSWHGHF